MYLAARYETLPVEGKVVSNDGKKLVVATPDGKKQHTLSLAKDSKATVDGKHSELSELKPGMKVRVFAKANEKTAANRVEALHQNQNFEKSLIGAPPPARGHAYDAKLVSATGNKLVLSELNGKDAHTVTITKDAKVFNLNGKECQLTDLKPGMIVHVFTNTNDRATATRVEALK
jgi:hypothetical protein